MTSLKNFCRNFFFFYFDENILARCRTGILQVFEEFFWGGGFVNVLTVILGVTLDSCFYYSSSNLHHYNQCENLLRRMLPGVFLFYYFFLIVFLEHSDFIDPFLKKIKKNG